METQPIVLVLLCGSLFFTGKSNDLLLEEGSTLLLLLSLYWWAMLIKHIIQPALSEKWAGLLHLPSLLATFAIIEGIHSALFNNALGIFLSVILVGWLWQRSIYRAAIGLQEEQLVTSFKIGFVVLLAALLFASLNTNPLYKILLTVLAYALPVFFASTLAALSFRRLGTIKRVYVHRSFVDTQINLTRTWLGTLMFLLVIMAVSSMILVVFAFQPLLIIFSPLEDILRMLYSWILSFFRPSQAKQLNHHLGPIPHNSAQPQPQYVYLPAILLLILVVVLSLLALFILIMLFLFIRGILRKWNRTRATGEDEVRESLSIRSILRERRQRRHGRSKVVLEQLDTTSARTRYRELLQAMAWHRDALGRRPGETPAEYQTRLLASIKEFSHNEEQQYSTPPDAAILDELTAAYTLERYGGKRTDHSRRAYLRQWVPILVKRLTSKKSKRAAQR